MSRYSFSLAAIGILTVATAARADDFEIDCTFFRVANDPKPERTDTPSKVTKSGEEGRFSEMRQIEWDGFVVAVGREVRVTARSGKDGTIKVEVMADLTEATAPHNLPQVQGTSLKTSAIVQRGGTVKVEFRKNNWVEITVRKPK